MIEVHNSYIIIRNISSGTTQKSVDRLHKMLSAYDVVAHEYYLSVYQRFGDDIYLPGTIDLNLIKYLFPFKKVMYVKDPEKEIMPIAYSMRNQCRNDDQKGAVKFLYGIKDDINRHRMLNLATGFGKTFVTIYTLSLLKMRSIIIVDTSELAFQWRSQFLKHSDLKEENIHIISGRDSLIDAGNEKYKIYIAMHKTLNMLIGDDPNALNKLFTDLKVGVRVFDEAHTNFKNMCNILDISDVKYNIYLTATPDRSAIPEKKLYQFVFYKVPKFTQLGFERYLNVLYGHIDSRPTIQSMIRTKTKYGFSIPIWANTMNDKRFKYLYGSIRKVIAKLDLIERNKKVAIMLPTINLITKVKENLIKDYPNISIGVFTGEVKKEDRRGELEKMFIITNDKIFDKGIDIPDLEILINYVPLQSEPKIKQIMGRIRNIPGLSHVYIDIADFGYPECRRQQSTRLTVYRKHANKVRELLEELGNEEDILEDEDSSNDIVHVDNNPNHN